MTEQIIIIVAILSFITIGFITKHGKIQSIGDFTISRNKLGWFPIAAGISMTFAGGAALLNMASLGYTFRWYNLVDPIAVTSGLIIVVLFIKRYRKDTGVTISDMLSDSNKSLSVLIGLITSIVFLLFLAAQFVALSKLLVPYFPSINPKLLTIIPSTLIFSYVFFGGFTSVTRTDIMQFFFILFLFLVPISYFFIFKENSAINISPEISGQKMPINLMILLAFPLLYIPFSQDINIRVKSAVSKKKAILGVLLGAFIYSSIIIASTYIGITLAKDGIVLDDPESALSIFFKTYFPSIGIIAIIATLAAIISSLDSYSLNAISSISNDLLLKFRTNKKQRTIINISALFVFTFSLIIALFFNQVLSLILTALLIYISVLIPIVLGKSIKINDQLIFISSIIIIGVICIIELFNVELSPKAVIYPVIGISLMLLFFVISKIKRP